MARPPSRTYPLPDGREVSASLFQRGNVWCIRFPDPNDPTKYQRPSTGCERLNDAEVESGKIILAAYTNAGLKPTSRTITWEQVSKELEDHGGKRAVKLRPSTLAMYRQAITNLMKTVATKGPADVTPETARRFATLFASTPYTRSNAEGAKQYTRGAKTVDNAIHFLGCLFSALVEMKFGTSNPFSDCPRPVVDVARPYSPDEADFQNLFATVDSLNWELMSVLIRVKAVAGCRTSDLCQVRSSQFDHRRHSLTITSGQSKTHQSRLIYLPKSLSVRLAKLAPSKPTAYLWEQYTTDTLARDARAATEFTPKRLLYAVRRVFDMYNDKFPDRPRITPHNLRARAITQAVKACNGSVDAGAELIGVTPQTARKHYVDPQKAYQTEKARKKLAKMLMPKT